MLLVATAIMLFAGCADNTYLGDQEAAKGSNRAIAFEGGTLRASVDTPQL